MKSVIRPGRVFVDFRYNPSTVLSRGAARPDQNDRAQPFSG
ncbi:hypothetical protein CP97_15083 (plasmid) [Aurantiacibacter atlanticus]|uniref:Uncharacterized protein n=1 Tax=Aurantiacibacter atlanticus TaxID=1648404 RepID=A0A160HUV0_9SPHN|nr:hypothetical protein CP97_15083 [Aurantiacibacter atlanticus]